jgi:hypothetical protein
MNSQLESEKYKMQSDHDTGLERSKAVVNLNLRQVEKVRLWPGTASRISDGSAGHETDEARDHADQEAHVGQFPAAGLYGRISSLLLIYCCA